jgi:hypothetical protein
MERINEKLKYVSVVTAIIWILWYYFTATNIYAIIPISLGVIVLVLSKLIKEYKLEDKS